MDEVEAERRDGPGCCSEEASPPPLALSSSGEVGEEWEVVEDVLDDEE